MLIVKQFSKCGENGIDRSRNGQLLVVRTYPRAIPLAAITIRKSVHGFSFLSYVDMGLRLVEHRYDLKGYVPVESKLKHPPGHTPGI